MNSLSDPASIFLYSTRIEAARCESWSDDLPFFHFHVAGCRGIKSQLIVATGRLR